MHIASLTPRPPRWLFNPCLLLVLAALSVWLLDGFDIGPANDGWIDLGLKIHPGGLLRQGNTSRILGSLPRALGTRLTDDSFVGWQLMLLVLTCLRSVLFYDIVRRLLPTERPFALACGLIALFHPADNSWFWVDATGAHLGLVLALAACWSTLAYLQGGVRAWLLASFLFQFTASITYTAYIPLMFAFPVGVWTLLWLQGARPSWRRLIGVTALVLLAAAAQLMLMAHGVGRESRVVDLHAHAVLMGYIKETELFFSASAGVFSGFKPVYLLYALLPALLAWFLARERGETAPEASRPRPAFHGLMLLGLVALAAVSYFSYALSDVRFGNKRQLLATGIFLYAALAYLLFVLLPYRLARWPRLRSTLPAVLLVLLTSMTVVVGLEKRTHFVDLYRSEEKLIAAVAALVPAPKAGSMVLVHLHSRPQAKQIAGFTNRPATFESALRVMYTDPSLEGNFLGPGPLRSRFTADGIVLKRRPGKEQRARTRDRRPQDTVIPFGRLILVDYPARGPARILDADWLAQQAGKGVDVSVYQPGGSAPRPGPDAIICTMLEKKFRPKYCAR
jgi:hypothetical protein